MACWHERHQPFWLIETALAWTLVLVQNLSCTDSAGSLENSWKWDS